MSTVAQTLGAWPFAASAVLAALVGGVRSGRRRQALNEALHELRRPLQAIALSGGPASNDSVRLAAAALERLEREVNGVGPRPRGHEEVDPKALIAAAVARWQRRARERGCSLTLRWSAPGAGVLGDSTALAQAIDNLIVNAIEHGGSKIVVDAAAEAGWLRVAVVDSGMAAETRGRRSSPLETARRLSGRQRRGHGLRVVERIAGDHGGRFSLRQGPWGATALIEIPLRPLPAWLRT